MAGSDCPQPSVSVQSSTVVPVTKANYSEAETQTVFAKYITLYRWFGNDFESPEGCGSQGSHGDSYQL